MARRRKRRSQFESGVSFMLAGTGPTGTRIRRDNGTRDSAPARQSRSLAAQALYDTRARNVRKSGLGAPLRRRRARTAQAQSEAGRAEVARTPAPGAARLRVRGSGSVEAGGAESKRQR